MKLARADADGARGPRWPFRASRVFDGGCWIVAIALLAVYCGLRSSGEIERRAALAAFFHSGGAPVAGELSQVEPAALPVLDTQP